MSLIERFLKLPLKFQINLSLIFILLITIILVFSFSEALILMNYSYIKSERKKYFLNMEQSLIENDINFINICLLQYENIIKLFNSQIYHYLNNETIVQDFYEKNKIPLNLSRNKIVVIKNKSDLDNYPEYYESIPDNEKKVYIYCGAKESGICRKIIDLIRANALIYLYLYKGIREFKIPFYGRQRLMNEYSLFFKKYSTFISINNTKMKDYMSDDGDIDEILDLINSLSKNDYNFNKRFFDEYIKNNIITMELMYNKIYYIFDDYKLLNDTYEKENYIMDKSIYFQTLDYTSDITYFDNTWNISKTRITGVNSVIPNSLGWILLNIYKKLDIVVLPINNFSKKLISKNLCYFFIYKQYYYLLNKNDISSQDKLEEIINAINNDENISDIKVCKLDNYFNDISEYININNEFFYYYDLKNIYDSYLYKLFKSDSRSYLFEMKSSFPNFESLKLFSPNFFTFSQIDFYSFLFGSNLSRIISSSEEFITNVNYFIIIVLWFFWIIIIIIFIIIILIVIPTITNPIVRLTQIINLNDSKNENIFEYKLDDDINKFFSLCKNLINGEMINNELKLNEILEDQDLFDNSANNNMIINNKMILELIENQKCINDNNKNIFLFKEGNANENKRDKSNNKLAKIRNRNFNEFDNNDVIKLISVNDEEIYSQKNSKKSKEIKEENEELYSKLDEDDLEANNLKLYEDLIKITDFVFYGKEKEKLNKNKKNLDKSSSVSKKSKPENSIKIIKGFENITYYWYMTEKVNRTIRRYTNIYS